jgi:hypothetical protein
MKQVVDEDTGRISYIAENEEDMKEFEQMAVGVGTADEDEEEESEEEDDNSSEEQSSFVKSEVDKQAVDEETTTTEQETPIILPDRTAAETELMRVMQIMIPILDKPNKILKQFPGATGVTPHLSIRKERAPVYTALIPVIRERNLTIAEVITELITKYAQETYTDLVTPADLKIKKIKAEQEAKAKAEQFKEDNPYIHLTKVPKYQRLEFDDIEQIDKKKVGGLIDVLLQDAMDLHTYHWGNYDSGKRYFSPNGQVELDEHPHETRIMESNAKRVIHSVDALSQSARVSFDFNILDRIDYHTKKELTSKAIDLLELIYDGDYVSGSSREEIHKRLTESKILKG